MYVQKSFLHSHYIFPRYYTTDAARSFLDKCIKSEKNWEAKKKREMCEVTLNYEKLRRYRVFVIVLYNTSIKTIE